MRVVTVKMPEDLYRNLMIYAHNHNMYISEVVRLAVQKLLEESKRDDSPTFDDYEADMKPLEPEQFIDFDKVLEGDLE